MLNVVHAECPKQAIYSDVVMLSVIVLSVVAPSLLERQ